MNIKLKYCVIIILYFNIPINTIKGINIFLQNYILKLQLYLKRYGKTYLFSKLSLI